MKRRARRAWARMPRLGCRHCHGRRRFQVRFPSDVVALRINGRPTEVATTGGGSVPCVCAPGLRI